MYRSPPSEQEAQAALAIAEDQNKTYRSWCARLRHAAPFTHHEYHIGNLAIDRLYDPALNKMASLFYALSELQYAILYQRRIEHDMHYFIVPCFRPLVEKVNAQTGAKFKRHIYDLKSGKIMKDEDGKPLEEQVYEHGPLQVFRSSRGFEHGCIAEAEQLARMAVGDMQQPKKRRKAVKRVVT